MNTTTPAPATSDRVLHAVEVLAPRWTSWTLESLRERGPQRARDLTAAMPWLNANATHQVLLRMQSTGLVTKQPERGYVAATRLGQQAHSTHRALASWHKRHFEQANPAWKRADRVEDALARLRGKGAVEVLGALEHGPLRPGELREAAGMATGSFHYRTQQLLDDGLVTRLGPEQHFSYALTPAARQLAPVYAELHDFGRRSQAAQGVGHERGKRPAATASRAAAARRSSPAAPAARGLFSHPPVPQPRVPAYVTALSHPSRAR
ncbi:winged helix-turn-helix transcriptional regulator [Streptomyces sp. NPDC048172]|uniref:winged helix-turn-helix transcriptional regulator n=1 Tax=Streptomyces sp. NPDC048172 TaxID=3365505 RepID=UPI00371D8C1F